MRQATDFELPVDGGALRGTRVGEGLPVILLHAGGERRRVWEPVAAALADAGFEAISYDQRGHGETEVGAPDGLADFSGDIPAMVEACDAPAVLVGSSLGGMAAMGALDDPRLRGRIAGLALIDVVPAVARERVIPYLLRAIGERAKHPLIEDIMRRAPLLAMSLREFEAPTLLVRGLGDSPLGPEDAVRFRSLVPQGRLEELDGVGHLVAAEAPQRLAAILGDWLAIHHHNPVAGLGSAALCDADPAEALDPAIQRVAGRGVISGPARIADCSDGNVAELVAAIRECCPGDVICVAGAERVASLGDMLGGAAAEAGAVGVVVDGLVRDLADLRFLPLSVHARGSTPAGATLGEPRPLSGQVSLGGVAVSDGDLIVADADGVAVAPATQAEEALRQAAATIEAEASGEAARRIAGHGR